MKDALIAQAGHSAKEYVQYKTKHGACLPRTLFFACCTALPCRLNCPSSLRRAGTKNNHWATERDACMHIEKSAEGSKFAIQDSCNTLCCSCCSE